MAPDEVITGPWEVDAEHFRSCAWGFPAGMKGRRSCLFTGRSGILSGLSAWLASSSGQHGGLRVLTGSPGSGKSAVLGAVVCSAHPALRRALPEISERLQAHSRPPLLDSLAIVHARDRATLWVLDSVASQLGLGGPPGSGGWDAESLVNAIQSAGVTPVIVLDALDEAAAPAELADELIWMAASGAARILVGARPWRDLFTPLLDAAGTAGGLIDLDDVPVGTLRADLAVYLDQLLAGSHHYMPDEHRRHVADAIAEMLAAQGPRLGAQFLAAGLVARHLGALPAVRTDLEAVRAAVPVGMARLLELALAQPGADQPLVRPVLAVLAHAKGAGMPESLIARRVRAFQDSARSADDLSITQSLEAARFYLRRNIDEDGAVLYRLFDQALGDQLASHPADPQEPVTDPRDVAGRLLDSLLEGLLSAPGVGAADGIRLAWDRAEPYLLRHAIEHAADAGRVDDLLTEPEFLVHARTGSVLEHLSDAGSDEARAWAAIYRLSAHRHRSRSPATRRDMLSIDAARWGLPGISRQLARPPWHTRWSTGTNLDSALLMQLAGHDCDLAAVAAAIVNGRPIAVTGDRPQWGPGGGELRIWDLLTGDQLGQPHTAHAGALQALAITSVDTRPVAVSTGNDATVRVWDLTTSEPLWSFTTGHTQWVTGIACTRVNGRPAVVTISNDNTVEVRDLATGEQIAQPNGEELHRIQDVTATVLDGRPVIITVGSGREAWIWDAQTGQTTGEPLIHETDHVAAVTTTMLHSGPIAITSTKLGLHIWDLSTRQPADMPLISQAVTHSGNQDSMTNWAELNPRLGRTELKPVNAIATTTLSGRPAVLAAAGEEHRPEIHAWDLETGAQLGRPLAGHTHPVRSLAIIPMQGSLAAVSAAGDERNARVWAIGGRPPVGQPVPGRSHVTQVAAAMVNGSEVIIARGYDRTIRIWDSDTGQMQRDMFVGYDPVKDMAVTTLHGRSVLIAQNIASNTPVLWDPGTRQPVGMLLGHEKQVNSVAATTVNGQPVAVTVSDDCTVRVWDLRTHMQIGEPLTGHTSRVGYVATTTLSGTPIAVTFGANDITLRVWDLCTLRPIGQPIDHGCGVDHLAATTLQGSPVAVTTEARTADILVWDLAHGQLLRRIPTGHAPDSDPIAITAEGHNGQTLAITASRFDYTVRIIDLTTGEAICRPLEFPDRPTALAITPQNRLVVGFGPDIVLLEPFALRTEQP